MGDTRGHRYIPAYLPPEAAAENAWVVLVAGKKILMKKVGDKLYMLAFTAEYESGDIQVDQFEIMDAGWYQADSLPDIPSADSVAGKMIRWYREWKGCCKL